MIVDSGTASGPTNQSHQRRFQSNPLSFHHIPNHEQRPGPCHLWQQGHPLSRGNFQPRTSATVRLPLPRWPGPGYLYRQWLVAPMLEALTEQVLTHGAPASLRCRSPTSTILMLSLDIANGRSARTCSSSATTSTRTPTRVRTRETCSTVTF